MPPRCNRAEPSKLSPRKPNPEKIRERERIHGLVENATYLGRVPLCENIQNHNPKATSESPGYIQTPQQQKLVVLLESSSAKDH
mmetsp:Transcript_18889/g.27327  ORF Transcript_18889/g.27327 Transcript_18889/m.27327 type:complete len:84 (+) Transcript_18889:565-816(+)